MARFQVLESTIVPLDVFQFFLVASKRRLAQRIVPLLVGKHKPTARPERDGGDYVVVTNVDKLVWTNEWRKMIVKRYFRHSTYAGGLKVTNLMEMIAKDPTEPLRSPGPQFGYLALGEPRQPAGDPQYRACYIGAYASRSR